MEATQSDLANATPQLRRVLGLPHLVLYGIVLIGSMSPPALFGVVQKLSYGHAVTTIFLSMVAMMLTAFSYGQMAALYPSAGSAYTYVGRGLNAHLGFFAGWAMLLDYMLVPLLCTIYCALAVGRLVPQVPYVVWVGAFAGAMTAVNVRGIRSTMTANLVMLILTSTLVFGFIGLAIYWLFQNLGWGGLISSKPFYDPAHFRWTTVATGASVAALTYGGFDGVTTLAEDVRNPKRNVLIATVLVCFVTGIVSGAQVYLSQLVHPDFANLTNVETAFMDVARVVGGDFLFSSTALVLIVASFGSGLSAQAGVSRLLFSMGRDRVLPGKFAYLHPKTNTPLFSILTVGLLALVGAVALSYESTAGLINFGAFLGFMGVNAAAFRQLHLRRTPQQSRNLFSGAVVPASGLIFSFVIWLSLPTGAKIMGSLWFAAGVIYAALKTNGFRREPTRFDFSES